MAAIRQKKGEGRKKKCPPELKPFNQLEILLPRDLYSCPLTTVGSKKRKENGTPRGSLSYYTDIPPIKHLGFYKRFWGCLEVNLLLLLFFLEIFRFSVTKLELSNHHVKRKM